MALAPSAERFHTALKNVGQVRKLSPHCCRRTYVTMLQANGVPMETIAALTGHSDIKTTEGYLHQSADTLAKAAEVLQRQGGLLSRSERKLYG